MNRLINETSPYLLQHAHNPVDWYPWGEEALERARKEDKPILVSIGYAACHWCHVMERESFENNEVAAYMNEHFIDIKVDREERPDIDHIYMDAVQAISGNGGWPLNVFLTPEKKPFYGGTYFPPVKAFNRTSWKEVLSSIKRTFTEKREEVEAQARQLQEHLMNANSFGSLKSRLEVIPEGERYTTQQTKLITDAIFRVSDTVSGGFSRAPKFPQSQVILFLLRQAWMQEDKAAMQQALLSLDKMCYGGIYDQLGGGFARYATDNEWLIPHFEKMLYDNALMLEVLSEAFQLTGNPLYSRVIRETVEFLEREMMDPSGGFYSALDADSEGVEGKFYVWSREEVESVLEEEADLFCRFYDITQQGNWEGHNILQVRVPVSQFAESRGMEADELERRLEVAKARLLSSRASRVRPGLDDKIILGWNALMSRGLLKSYEATGEEHYLQLAERNLDFLLEAFGGTASGEYHHLITKNRAGHLAFLDDYSYLSASLLLAYEVSGRTTYLNKAIEVIGLTLRLFADGESPYFFYTSHLQTDVIVRKKEVYDGATPSGNAVMASVLYKGGLLADRVEWKERAAQMMEELLQAVIRYPTSFGTWACLLQEWSGTTLEIAIVGEEYRKGLREVLNGYWPHRVIAASTTGQEGFPLLEGRGQEGRTLYYLCKDYSCRKPVENSTDFMQLLEMERKS